MRTNNSKVEFKGFHPVSISSVDSNPKVEIPCIGTVLFIQLGLLEVIRCVDVLADREGDIVLEARLLIVFIVRVPAEPKSMCETAIRTHECVVLKIEME